RKHASNRACFGIRSRMRRMFSLRRSVLILSIPGTPPVSQNMPDHFTTSAREYQNMLDLTHVFLSSKKLSQSPDMICQSRFHRRSDSKRGVNTAPVVVSEMERESGIQVLPLL